MYLIKYQVVNYSTCLIMIAQNFEFLLDHMDSLPFLSVVFVTQVFGFCAVSLLVFSFVLIWFFY